MLIAFNINAQPPDPCDDCFLEFFLGNINDVELEDCLINAGCQDVPISLDYIWYSLLIFFSGLYYFIKTKKLKFAFLNS